MQLSEYKLNKKIDHIEATNEANSLLDYLKKEETLNEKEVEKAKKEISQLSKDIYETNRYIFGFGRGYFAGDGIGKFLVEKENELYWIVRNFEIEDNVQIYKILKGKKKLKKFLTEKDLEKDIFEFDSLLDKLGFWSMTHGKYDKKRYEKIDIEMYYGISDKDEDVKEHLKEYINLLTPAEYGIEYPNKRFHKEFTQNNKSERTKEKAIQLENVEEKKSLKKKENFIYK